jgi:hypothetical protein
MWSEETEKEGQEKEEIKPSGTVLRSLILYIARNCDKASCNYCTEFNVNEGFVTSGCIRDKRKRNRPQQKGVRDE